MASGRIPTGGLSRQTLLSQLGASQQDSPNLYWDARHPSQGGTGRVETSMEAPSPDHYRLVDSLDEASQVIQKGERPLLIGNLSGINPDEIDPGILRSFQESQWAAPNGIPLFTDQGINPEHQQAWAARQSGELPKEP